MKTNLIGIHTLSVSTEMIDFARSGIYRTVPLILYKINEEKVRYFLVQRPIEIFRENMDYRNLKNIVHGGDKDISFLSIPGKAYNKICNYEKQNVNKVIADMITHVVVEIICKLKEEDPKAKNIFFIDSEDTNKIIGRLGYLYLESKYNTISFITYRAGGLMTDILNSGNEKLIFDINYFKKEGRRKSMYSEIIPNDYMESLTQTVFFKIPSVEAELSPLRCDILSQGLSKNQIQKKVEDIKGILNCPANMSLPFFERDGKNGNENCIMIPQILMDCIDADKVYKHVAQSVLEEELYETNR